MKEKRLETFKKHLLVTYPEGIFSAGTNDFKEVLGIKSNNTVYMNQLLESGFLTKVEEARKPNKTWIPAKYKINPSCTVENKDSLPATEIFSNKVDFIEFNGEYLVAVADICSVLNLERQTLNAILQRNKEMFASMIVRNQSLGKRNFLNRKGLITLLMKLCTSRIDESKKQEIIEFQMWAIDALDSLVSKGYVKLTKVEHDRVKTNITNILETEREQVDKLFMETRDMLGNIIVLFNRVEAQREIYTNRCNELETEISELKERNEILQMDKESYKKAYEVERDNNIRFKNSVRTAG